MTQIRTRTGQHRDNISVNSNLARYRVYINSFGYGSMKTYFGNLLLMRNKSEVRISSRFQGKFLDMSDDPVRRSYAVLRVGLDAPSLPTMLLVIIYTKNKFFGIWAAYSFTSGHVR